MNTVKETATEVVLDYKHYLEFISERQGYTLEQLSYSNWAIDEILRLLEESTSQPPLIVIEDFIEKVDYYSRLNGKSNSIFSIVSNTANNIIDTLISQR